MDDDDMFSMFDEAPARASKSSPATHKVAPAIAQKRKAEDDAPPAKRMAGGGSTPAEAAAKTATTAATMDAPPLAPAHSREYEMLDRYIKDKMDNAKRIRGQSALNVTPKRTVHAGRSSCTHEVAYPAGIDAVAEAKASQAEMAKPRLTPPAKEYGFTLDSFQQISVDCIEAGESVLVSAHTSAGKTAVAEYAIALSLRDRQRVVYTCPIKALSNQKYRDLYEEFQDVGLMTGDVTINPQASCLVMTTEILRSMLYRGASETREIAWVIYDEVHYMRDKERGVVWEESIVMLPSKVRFVFLSATIPNASEFAAWVAKVHNNPCNVVYTDYRPTPLQHYMFPVGGEGLYLVVDGAGDFKADNFSKAVAALADAPPGGGKGRGGGGSISGGKGGRGGKGKGKGGRQAHGADGGQSDIFKIVKMIADKQFEPCIVFAFSKRETESLALQMAKLNFNSDDESALVEQVFTNAVESLSEDDRRLPQIEHILPLLKRGIGMHHSGLLPILKEVIEILFQESLIKCLFATETFSMGLNMPARTVVFTAVRKFDGSAFRWISSGEYIQMSGRAGRRGLDDKGIVIQMIDEKMEPAIAKDMLRGAADPLKSTFHLGYNMLLNLYRVEDANPEKMIISSFLQFQNDVEVPDYNAQIEAKQERLQAIVVQDEEAVSDYHHAKTQINQLQEVIRAVKTRPLYALPFLQPGRLIRVTDGADEWGWGVVVSFQKQKAAKGLPVAEAKPEHYTVSVLLRADDSAAQPRPAPAGVDGEMLVIPVFLTAVSAFSSIRIHLPNDLRSKEARHTVGSSLGAVLGMEDFKEGLPELDLLTDMKIKADGVKSSLKKISSLQTKLLANRLHGSDELPAGYAAYEQKVAVKAEISSLNKLAKSSNEMILRAELKGMKRVLRRLGLLNPDNVVEAKGRVACEVDSADELVITELIFTNSFSELDIDQIVALCSCFAYGENSKDDDAEAGLEEALMAPLRVLQETARRVARVKTEAKLVLDEEEYVASFTPALMKVAYEWSKGAKFAELIKMTEIFEGSIIRAMRRLEELLRQLMSAANAIGNAELEGKFEAAIKKIKRDIIFSASLYL